MTSAETPAAPSPKSSNSGWQKPTITILGIVCLIMVGANVTFSLNKPKQDLLITNTGSQSVDIRNLADSWWNERRPTLTLHPGMTGIWMFRDGDQFRITRSAEQPPKPGTTPPNSPLPPRSESLGTALTHNPDSSGTIVIKHAFRSAEVHVNDAGKIEFEFTDL